MQDIVIPLTREQLEAKRAQAAENGVVLTGDHGKATAHNVSIQYDYDGVDLTIKVLSKPFYYPDGEVESAILNWFK